MDLSGFGRPPTLAGRSNVEPLDPQALIAQLGSEVATTLSAALDRVAALEATGQVDGETLRLLREEIDLARRAGIMGQQVVRLCNGQVQLANERLDLTALLREALRQRGREIELRGIEVRQILAPALVKCDATLLFSLLQVVLDWAFEHTVSRIDLTLEVKTWPPHARLVVAFAHRPADEIDTGADATEDETALNTMSWRLLQQTATVLALRMQRTDPPGRTVLEFEFPDTLARRVEPEGTTNFEESIAPALAPQPLVGRHVLVLTGRREVRNVVREALRPLGLMVDFVGSVEEVQQQCADAMPHAIVYEASLGGQRFNRLRDELLAQARQLAFIQIAEQGKAMQVMNVGGHQLTSVGRDAIIESLPEALTFELTRAQGG
jgi:CheY-like chemotaxis protein